MIFNSDPMANHVPSPSRSSWQPNTHSVVPFPLHQDVIQLAQRLDTAERKVDEYARLSGCIVFSQPHLQTIEYEIVASLSAELRRYQDVVCHACRENIIRASLATGSPPNPAGFVQSASQPIAASTESHTLSVHVQTCTASSAQEPSLPIASSLGVRRYPQSSRISKRARVHSPRQFGDNNPHNLIVSPDNPQLTLTHLPTPTVPTAHSVDANFNEPLLSISETAASAGPTLPNPVDPEWPVEYNPEVKQGLSVHLANTLKFTHKVFCTTFSRDGKYLAVGLGNGEMHVYNMLTGSKRSVSSWSVASVDFHLYN